MLRESNKNFRWQVAVMGIPFKGYNSNFSNFFVSAGELKDKIAHLHRYSAAPQVIDGHGQKQRI